MLGMTNNLECLRTPDQFGLSPDCPAPCGICYHCEINELESQLAVARAEAAHGKSRLVSGVVAILKMVRAGQSQSAIALAKQLLAREGYTEDDSGLLLIQKLKDDLAEKQQQIDDLQKLIAGMKREETNHA